MKLLKTLAVVALGLAISVTAHRPAHAQVCSTECSRYEEGECVEHTETCTTTPSVPQPSYGAIAFGRKSHAFGYSYSWGNRSKAESVAMQNCGKHGGDCEVMVWFDRKCGAVSSGFGNTAFWGLAGSDAAARSTAQSQCAKGGGGASCKVEVSRCSW